MDVTASETGPPGRYRRGLLRLRQDAGSASLAGVGVVLGLILLLGAVLAGHSILVTHQRVAGAADAAALAAADTALGFVAGVPCERAEQVARLNRARMVDCTVEGYEVHVATSQSVLSVTVQDEARAGPARDAA